MLFAVLSMSLLASCDKKNTEPDKTPEQIAQENLAEFKAFFGKDGIISIPKNHLSAELNKMVGALTEDEKQALEFQEEKDRSTRLKIEGEYLFFDDVLAELSSGTIEKKGSKLIFTSYQSIWRNAEDINDPITVVGDLICIIDTETKFVEFAYYCLEFGGSWDKFNTKPYVPSKSSVNSITTRSVSTRTYDSFNDNRMLYVKLYSNTWIVKKVFENKLKPWGWHNVLFTTENGVTRVQFCGPNGELSGNDYFYKTTHHFWKNKMPMALNFENVTFCYNASNGEITPGNGVIAYARRNDNPEGFLPFFIKNKVNQNSGPEATIIKTEGNNPNHFLLDVKLDFEVDVHCLISDEVISNN